MGKGRLEFYDFAGSAAMNGTFGNSSSSDQSIPGVAIARMPITGHGLKAYLNRKYPTHIFVRGLTNYNDGLYRIHAVATNTVDLVVKTYTAENPNGDAYFAGLMFDEDWLFEGYALHQNAAGTTSENFTIDVDAKAGTYWDTNIVTVPMNGVADYWEIFDEPFPMKAKDILVCNYANSNTKTWGLRLMARRMN